MANTEHSHLLKIFRAREHLGALEGHLRAWFDDHSTYVLEPDPGDEAYYLLKATVDPIPANPISLIIGDVVHNLRSSLDHLAFALAAGFTKPLPDRIARNCQFPIVGDEDNNGNSGLGATLFKKNGLLMIQGIDPKAQTVIEVLQPYHERNNFRSHPLWQLRELSNVDKHRLLHLVVTVSTGMGFTPDKSENWVITPGTLEVFAGEVKRDTRIARIPLRPRHPDRPMHFEVRPGFVMAFGDGGSAGKAVLQALDEIHRYVFINQSHHAEGASLVFNCHIAKGCQLHIWSGNRLLFGHPISLPGSKGDGTGQYSACKWRCGRSVDQSALGPSSVRDAVRPVRLVEEVALPAFCWKHPVGLGWSVSR